MCFAFGRDEIAINFEKQKKMNIEQCNDKCDYE